MSPCWATVLLLLLLQVAAPFAAFLDDTYRNDGLSRRDARLHRSAVFEAVQRSAAGGSGQAPVYFSLSHTLRAPTHPEVPSLPACWPASEVSAALAAAINAAFAQELVQAAIVDTTYVQKLDQCSYSSFIAYSGPTDIATAVVNAGRGNTLCDTLPTYCTALNILSSRSVSSGNDNTAQKARRRVVLRPQAGGGSSSEDVTSGNPGSSTRRSKVQAGGALSNPGGMSWLQQGTSRARSSAAPHKLLQSGGSTEPELPPVLHYNCQKHSFIQKLDHFGGQQRGEEQEQEHEHPQERQQQREGPEDHGASAYPGAPDSREPDYDQHHGPEPGPDYGVKPGPDPGPYHDVQEPKHSNQHPPLPHQQPHYGEREFEGLGNYGFPDISTAPPTQSPRELRRAIKRIRRAIKRDRLQQAVLPNQAAVAAADETLEQEAQEQAHLQVASLDQQPGSQQQGSRVQFGGGVVPSLRRPTTKSDIAVKHQEQTAGPRLAQAPVVVKQKVATPLRQQPAAAVGQQVPTRSGQQVPMPLAQQLLAPVQQQQVLAPVQQQVLTPVQQQQQVLAPVQQQQQVVAPVQQQQQVVAPVQQQVPAPLEQQQQITLPRAQQAPPRSDPAGNTQQLRDLFNQGLFQQVYWVCDAAWPAEEQQKESSGNVLVFLGNEAPLGTPQQPIIFENARRLNALVVLVEHRYYGESMPFRPATAGLPSTDYYRWLTMDQAIEDTASIVAHVRAEHRVPSVTPNIVVGGSYGGMLATYHRLKRPDMFAAAVAASAPVKYLVDTPSWGQTSNRFHQFIKRSVDVMSGSSTCSDTITTGLEKMLDATISSTARSQLARTFQLCDESALDSKEAVVDLQLAVLRTFMWIAQLNNQPPVLGQMATACGVLANTTAAGGTAVEALAAIFTYFYHSGDADWCLNYRRDPKSQLLDAADSFSYQSCTEGVTLGSMLPAQGSAGTLNPEDIPARLQDIQEACRTWFGSELPRLRPPGYARNFMRLLRRTGGVVFTNGDLDGWAGGSLGLGDVLGTRGDDREVRRGRDGDRSRPASNSVRSSDSTVTAAAASGAPATAPAPAANLTAYISGPREAPPGGEGYGGEEPPEEALENVAFIVYKNASHCTDTHLEMWQMAGEPAAWKQQRAAAMDHAVAFARSNAVRQRPRNA